jgi:hypothetical protein
MRAEKAVLARAASSGDGFDALFRAAMQTMHSAA